MKVKFTILFVAIIILWAFQAFAQDYYPAHKEWYLWKLTKGEIHRCGYSQCYDDIERTWSALGQEKYGSSWACARAARIWQRAGYIIACMPRGMTPHDIGL